MSQDKQRLTDYLAHILEAIERIGRYTEHMSETAFLENSMVQDAVIRNVEIIREASNNVERLYPRSLPLTRSCPWHSLTRCAM